MNPVNKLREFAAIIIYMAFKMPYVFAWGALYLATAIFIAIGIWTSVRWLFGF